MNFLILSLCLLVSTKNTRSCAGDSKKSENCSNFYIKKYILIFRWSENIGEGKGHCHDYCDYKYGDKDDDAGEKVIKFFKFIFSIEYFSRSVTIFVSTTTTERCALSVRYRVSVTIYVGKNVAMRNLRKGFLFIFMINRKWFNLI